MRIAGPGPGPGHSCVDQYKILLHETTILLASRAILCYALRRNFKEIQNYTIPEWYYIHEQKYMRLETDRLILREFTIDDL